MYVMLHACTVHTGKTEKQKTGEKSFVEFDSLDSVTQVTPYMVEVVVCYYKFV